MQYIIVGLGNPGQEYEFTRHNTGRIIVDAFAKKLGVDDEWKEDKKIKSEILKTKIGKNTVILIKPNTFMNKSGDAVRTIVTSKKAAETLVVIHDELDMPFGNMKMSFNKSAGGHRGVQSIVKAVKTEGFIRLRVGISGATAKGTVKKPQGEDAVEKLILGKFKPAELDALKKMSKRAVEGLEILLDEGREIATGKINSGN
jgi:PTH1 family peptidyl-tRNA hydrolase